MKLAMAVSNARRELQGREQEKHATRNNVQQGEEGMGGKSSVHSQQLRGAVRGERVGDLKRSQHPRTEWLGVRQ